MKYKLLASDLDGTFLNNKSQIPDTNKEAVKIIQERGVKFVLCSGRSHISMTKFVEELSLNEKGTYGISFNGAMVYELDTLKPLSEHIFDKDLAHSILKSTERFNAEPVVYSREKLFCKRESANIESLVERSSVNCIAIENMENIDEIILKILLVGEHEELQEIKAYTESLFAGQCNIFFSERYFLEFTNLKATKGNGLEFLADYLDIDIKETIAVGDNFNDVSMIEKAGLGIAVINGEEKVKEIADYVTKTDNNMGVIKEIAENFL